MPPGGPDGHLLGDRLAHRQLVHATTLLAAAPPPGRGRRRNQGRSTSPPPGACGRGHGERTRIGGCPRGAAAGGGERDRRSSPAAVRPRSAPPLPAPRGAPPAPRRGTLATPIASSKRSRRSASGPTHRPSVYRTLAQLERDGPVDVVVGRGESAQARRLYRLTPEGERALRVLMGVIKEERDRPRRCVAAACRERRRRRCARRRRGRVGRGAQPTAVTGRGPTERVGTTVGGAGAPSSPTWPAITRAATRPPRRRAGPLGSAARGPLVRSDLLTFGVVGLTGPIETRSSGRWRAAPTS